MRVTYRHLLLVGLALLLTVGPASATIISATNAVNIQGFPNGLNVSDDLLGGGYASPPGPGSGDEGGRYFTEGQADLTGILLNVVNPTPEVIYGPEQGGSPGMFAPGTYGTSHTIFWDPLNGTPGTHTSTYTFNDRIAGIIWSTSLLAASDPVFGLPSVIYGGAFGARGLEDHLATSRDNVFADISGKTLTFNSQAAVPGDWIRVITVPEPSSVALLGLGVGALARRRRR